MLRRLSVASVAVLGLLLSAPASTAFAQEGAKKPAQGKKTPPKKKGKKGKKGDKKKKNDGVGPFKKKDYPIQERLRPLVLPDGMGEVGLDLGYVTVGGADAAATSVSFSYGVADVVDFGVSTSLLLSPEVDWGQNLNLQAHYLAYDTKEFDFAPGLLVPLVLADGAGFNVALDLPCRYVLNDVLFFYFGNGAVPIAISPDFSLALQANGGAGFQVDKGLVITVDTSVFTMLVVPDVDFTGLWDFLVLNAGVQYSWSREWDVGARLGIVNFWEGGDPAVAVSLYGAYRF